MIPRPVPPHPLPRPALPRPAHPASQPRPANLPVGRNGFKLGGGKGRWPPDIILRGVVSDWRVRSSIPSPSQGGRGKSVRGRAAKRRAWSRPRSTGQAVRGAVRRVPEGHSQPCLAERAAREARAGARKRMPKARQARWTGALCVGASPRRRVAPCLAPGPALCLRRPLAACPVFSSPDFTLHLETSVYECGGQVSGPRSLDVHALGFGGSGTAAQGLEPALRSAQTRRNEEGLAQLVVVAGWMDNDVKRPSTRSEIISAAMKWPFSFCR